MSSKVIYERFWWFNDQVKSERYPNSVTLARRFEVSRKTGQRDIDFMRDRLNAPLVYVPEKRGYTYEEKTYELPGIWIKEVELAALFISFRLASTIPDKELKSSLKSFLAQILSSYSFTKHVSLDKISQKVSVKNIEYSQTSDTIFQAVINSLFSEKSLTIHYYSPHKNEDTQRDILPLHLLQYMGSWHLIAFCTLRGQLRYFTLSRIRAVKPSVKSITYQISSGSLKKYIRKNFGILSSEDSMEICLKFSRKIAPWISEQIWHPEQKRVVNPDGTLCLTFPAADLREIRGEVLKYGAQVEVLSPPALKEEVKKEIKNMQKIY
ncbi:MAG: WYL domain-containing protein [Thermodesulfobacteriota bacterium]|nr:WYL domain-containing protein [Thermodesulfobacteriota bacterium]